MSGWDDADRDGVPMFTDGLLAAIEERRNDKAFMARLEANIAKHKTLLDRLAASDGAPTALTQDARVTTSWRRIAEQDATKLTGPISRTVNVERTALLALVEIAERGIEARRR